MLVSFAARARPEDDVGFRPTAFSDPPTARRSLLQVGNAMLNNALAVGVAGAVVVVTATILGAVELLWKAVLAIAGP